MRLALPGQKLSVQTQPLFKDRHTEATPKHVSLTWQKHAIAEAAQDDDCIAKAGEGKRTSFNCGANAAEIRRCRGEH